MEWMNQCSQSTIALIISAREDFVKKIQNKEDEVCENDIVDFIYTPKAKGARWARLAVILTAGIYEREWEGNIKGRIE